MKLLRSGLPFLLMSFVSSQDGDLALMTDGGGGSVAGATNVINLAGIYDTTVYTWSPDIFEVTVDLINKGWWGALPNTKDYRLDYSLENSNCDETTAARSWWKLRGENGDRSLDGIIGARCSGASSTLARISGLEKVPHLSPASNSAALSNKEEFPYFSRLTAANDARGEVGATIAMLRSFGWSNIVVLNTDTVFAKDWAVSFTKEWTKAQDDWVGNIAYSDTLRLAPDGTINAESIRSTLNGIPDAAGRVILLAAHSQHAFRVLEEASNIDFQPDTIWVGGSSWAPRYDDQDFNWAKDTIPGYLGVAPFRNRDENYDAFLAALQNWEEARGKPATTELPAFARETVDSIRAMATALSFADNKRDGESVVRALRDLKFDGVSGRVEFTEEGDRKDPRYSVFNAKSIDSKGILQWTEIGVTDVQIGSTEYFNGIQEVCFAEAGCNLESPPSDLYPESPLPIPGWTIPVLIVIICLLLFAAAYAYRENRRKILHKTELKALQQSVAGMRTAETNYIPNVTKEFDLEEQAVPTMKKRSGSVVVETAKWMWQETPGYIGNHDASQLYGEASDLWVLYDAKSTKKLESAYKRKKAKVSPLPGYEVDLKTMTQTKLESGFTRSVQRVLHDDKCTRNSQRLLDIDSATEVSFDDIDVGDCLPADLDGEAQMVLVKGDVVQISKTRPYDDWSFGTKLHTDEVAARNLVQVACNGVDPDKANIFHDSGWFQQSKTRAPTAEDLKFIRENVGDDALAPPTTWTEVKDPSVAEKYPLPQGQERAAVEKAFLSTLNPAIINIVKVERIQNLAMWQSYVVKRQTICHRETKKNGAADDQVQKQKQLARYERAWLFHGTNVEVMDKIIQQGFNRSFCGKNATFYGKGVYFAKEASYSSCSTYAQPDRNGFQHVMLCRVAVGEYSKGVKDALTPDMRDNKTHTLYDSTVDRTTDPTVFVTYHDAQAYPEYLVTFKDTSRK